MFIWSLGFGAWSFRRRFVHCSTGSSKVFSALVNTEMKRALSLLLVSFIAPALSRAASVDYGRDILPILSDKCYHCHGPDEKARKAKLRLDSKDGAFAPRKGGEKSIV